ncbi:MAG: hypothetical protein A2X46_04980 [Lentisphaerae bacterium GWF2_57_35]|nr:MAG: hypothetical protein A2X46_04980 [Lentisphaerae bacterium GWF2_57_35]
MSTDFFEGIISDIYDKTQFVHLYGQGEPLLNRSLMEMIRICKKYYVDDTLATNVSLLTHDFSLGLLESGLEQIMFSVTGATKDSYESLHPGGNFERVCENIISFFIAELECGKFIRTRSNFVEDPLAAPSLKRYREMFALLPIDYVSVSRLINWFGHNKARENFPETCEEWLKVPTCKAPWRMMGIDVEGNVRACFIDINDDNIIGNVNDAHILDIWNGDKMQQFRKALVARDMSEGSSFCRLCSKCNSMVESKALTNSSNEWPHDLATEVNKYFNNGDSYFGYKRQADSNKTKFEFVRKYGDKWIAQMVYPAMSDEEFYARYVVKG